MQKTWFQRTRLLAAIALVAMLAPAMLPQQAHAYRGYYDGGARVYVAPPAYYPPPVYYPPPPPVYYPPPAVVVAPPPVYYPPPPPAVIVAPPVIPFGLNIVIPYRR